MKIEIEDVNAVKKSMTVEVDADEVDRETRKVVQDYARKARIPGFRPGKAPQSLIRSKFGSEIDDDVKEGVVRRSFHEAIHEKGFKPLGEPNVEEVTYEEGQPLRFKTTFEILPEFEVKNYKEIEVRKPGTTVTDEDVTKALEELRESRASLVVEEGRESVTGDFLVMDVEGTPEEGETFNREQMLIEVGATDNLPAFNEKLLGVTAGQELEFPVEYPKEYGAKELAGKMVRYRVEVQEVKRRVLPDLDDEFAKDLGEFDDLAALKANIEEKIRESKEGEAKAKVRQSILDKALIENPVVLPDVLVEAEIRHRMEDLVRELMMRGMEPEKMELDWADLRKRQEEPARKGVHARLLLDKVALAESLEVTDEELDDRIRRDAKAIGESYEKAKKNLRERGGLEVVRSQLLREKSLDLMTSVANIQEEE
jgi:trigger factor